MEADIAELRDKLDTARAALTLIVGLALAYLLAERTVWSEPPPAEDTSEARALHDHALGAHRWVRNPRCPKCRD